MRNLHVWSDSTHIGVFSQRSGGSLVRFEYDDAKGAPISLSLPRTGAYSGWLERSKVDLTAYAAYHPTLKEDLEASEKRIRRSHGTD